MARFDPRTARRTLGEPPAEQKGTDHGWSMVERKDGAWEQRVPQGACGAWYNDDVRRASTVSALPRRSFDSLLSAEAP